MPVIVSPTSILILEDERPQLLALRSALKAMGDIKEFDNPSAALDFLKSHAVDAAIIDVHMPKFEIDGMAFINRVRSFDSDLSVILRTGDDSTQLADNAIEARVFRRVIKGRTTVEELRKLVSSAVSATRLRRQISMDAADAEDARNQLAESLSSVEENHSVTDSYKQVIRELRNHLTEASVNASVLETISATVQNVGLQRAVEKNNASIAAAIGQLNSFLDNPYADSIRSTVSETRSTANGIVRVLERKFQNSPKWTANRATLRFKGMLQDMLIPVQPLRLITATRHVIEYTISGASPEALISIEVSVREGKRPLPAKVDGESLLLGNPNEVEGHTHLVMRVAASNDLRTLSAVRTDLETQNREVHEANLKMALVALRAENYALRIECAASRLAFELLLPLGR